MSNRDHDTHWDGLPDPVRPEADPERDLVLQAALAAFETGIAPRNQDFFPQSRLRVAATVGEPAFVDSSGNPVSSEDTVELMAAKSAPAAFADTARNGPVLDVRQTDIRAMRHVGQRQSLFLAAAGMLGVAATLAFMLSTWNQGAVLESAKRARVVSSAPLPAPENGPLPTANGPRIETDAATGEPAPQTLEQPADRKAAPAPAALAASFRDAQIAGTMQEAPSYPVRGSNGAVSTMAGSLAVSDATSRNAPSPPSEPVPATMPGRARGVGAASIFQQENAAVAGQPAPAAQALLFTSSAIDDGGAGASARPEPRDDLKPATMDQQTSPTAAASGVTTNTAETTAAVPTS